MRKPITIGIPTYNRPREVARLVSDLLREGLSESAEITVIDDGPSAETATLLEPMQPEIKLIQHDANRGYARTFAELFSTCETEYLMITADDDEVIRAGVMDVIDFVTSARPDFVSTVWLRDGRIHRGKAVQAPVRVSEVRPASNHAPGLVYRVEATRPHLDYLNARLERGCYASLICPQVVIAYSLVLAGRACFWHPAAPVKEGAKLPSNLRSESGDLYYSLPGRYKEHVGFLDLFEDLSRRDFPDAGRNAASALRSLHGQQIYQLLSSGIQVDHSSMMPNWIAGSVFYSLRQPATTLRCLLGWVQDRRKHHKRLARAESELLGSSVREA